MLCRTSRRLISARLLISMVPEALALLSVAGTFGLRAWAPPLPLVLPADGPAVAATAMWMGVLMQLAGVWLWVMGARELRRQGTTVMALSASEPPSTLVVSGIFGFSRNPMCAWPSSYPNPVADGPAPLALRPSLSGEPDSPPSLAARFCTRRRGLGRARRRICGACGNPSRLLGVRGQAENER